VYRRIFKEMSTKIILKRAFHSTQAMQELLFLSFGRCNACVSCNRCVHCIFSSVSALIDFIGCFSCVSRVRCVCWMPSWMLRASYRRGVRLSVLSSVCLYTLQPCHNNASKNHETFTVGFPQGLFYWQNFVSLTLSEGNYNSGQGVKEWYHLKVVISPPLLCLA